MFKIPVVVTPLVLSGLEAVRLLAREGLEVLGYDEDKLAIGHYSRYCTSIRSWNCFLQQQETDFVLLPVSDEAVWNTARDQDSGMRYGKWVRPDTSLLQKCLDKLLLAEWASAEGVPCPRTWELGEVSAFREEKVDFPVVVKPRMHSLQSRSAARKILGNAKVLRLDTMEQLGRVAEDTCLLGNLGDWVVQEVIHTDSRHLPLYISGYISQRGESVAFSHRKIRTSPPLLGIGVYIESCQEPAMEGRILNWLLKSGYRGIFGVELLYDKRYGEYLLIDFNPRFGIGDTIGCAFGINLPYIAYVDAIGERVEMTKRHPPKPVRWMAEFWDMGVARRMIAKGDLRLIDYLRSIAYRPLWLGFWDRRDPLPFLVMLWRLLRRNTRGAYEYEQQRGYEV